MSCLAVRLFSPSLCLPLSLSLSLCVCVCICCLCCFTVDSSCPCSPPPPPPHLEDAVVLWTPGSPWGGFPWKYCLRLYLSRTPDQCDQAQSFLQVVPVCMMDKYGEDVVLCDTCCVCVSLGSSRVVLRFVVTYSAFVVLCFRRCTRHCAVTARMVVVTS